MKHDKLLHKAARFPERMIPNVSQIEAKGDGKVFRHSVTKGFLKDERAIKAVKLADQCRSKIEKLKDESDPRTRRDETERLRAEYLRSIEKMKSERVGAILKKLEDSKIRAEDGLKYAKAENISLDTLELEKAKLRALTMTEKAVDAAIGNADRTGIYSEIELLALATNATDKQRRRIGEVIAENPAYLATPEAQNLLAELEAFTSAGAGRLPYKNEGAENFILTNALDLLNDPEKRKPDPRAQNVNALREGLQRAQAAKDRELIKDLLARIEELEAAAEPAEESA
ncbi:hypothetical protein [Marispirochaeta aestuarii]|uniref:hypothetical protein n=1 Tax=Marispirochaeta aestuarii TaxID=1963862 RepID=UPI0029C66DB2|nr:hypothetical protein [Marispirochaeta aestuarii]